MNDTEAKADILKFIIDNSGQYYEVGIELNFMYCAPSQIQRILKELEAENKIRSNGGLIPYRVVKA
jgi:hypothetical protein